MTDHIADIDRCPEPGCDGELVKNGFEHDHVDRVGRICKKCNETTGKLY